MLPSTRVVLCLAFTFLTVSVAVPAAAQTNLSSFQGFQFNFSTPGSRAAAMGTTFIGVADDATAAVTNPGGLIALTRPQVYFEFQAQLEGEKAPRLSARDSFFTLATRDAIGDQIFPSFVSVAAPIRGRMAVSFARHQFLAYKEFFHYEPRLSHNGSVLDPVFGKSQLTGASYAASIATAIGDSFRLGVTVAAAHLGGSLEETRYQFTGSGLDAVETDKVKNGVRLLPNKASSASVTIGALYRRNERISLGAVYTKAPSFTLQAGSSPFAMIPGSSQPVSIHVPSRGGFGVSIRPVSRVLVAADVERIQYSNLMKDFVVIDAPLTPANFTIRDATEFRLGGEYNLKTGGTRLFVRGGVFTIHDHGVRFVPTSDLAPTVVTLQTDQFNLLPQRTKITASGGFGLVAGRRLQLDFALTPTYISLSTMVRLN